MFIIGNYNEYVNCVKFRTPNQEIRKCSQTFVFILGSGIYYSSIPLNLKIIFHDGKENTAQPLK